MRFSLEENLFGEYHLEAWQMTFDQRLAFVGLLEHLHPDVSIEIGTFRAGSLSAISKYSNNVYSIDIDPEIPQKYGDLFDNVEYLTGKSQDILPKLLSDIEKSERNLNFVLIDGDHSEKAVRDDCNLILRHHPKQPVFIVMHDTFNPAVRRGILSADWAENPYVQELHLDFVLGQFHDKLTDHNYRELWGGLGLAVMTPEKRLGDVNIIERGHKAHEILLSHSAHYRETFGINKLFAGIRRLLRRWQQN